MGDGYTRAVVTLIAIGVLVLVVRSFSSSSGTPEMPRGEAGRYQLQNFRVGRVPSVIRIDTETGETWLLQGRPREAVWVPVGTGLPGDVPPETAADEPAAEAPEPPAEPASP